MADQGSYSKGYGAGLKRATKTVLRLRAEVQRLRYRIATGAPMAPEGGRAAWVCPWGICNHEEAQECRADALKGCGGRFPPGTTLEQAKEMIGPLKRGTDAEGGHG